MKPTTSAESDPHKCRYTMSVFAAYRPVRSAPMWGRLGHHGDARELAEMRLDVYDSLTGLWNPDHGELVLPAGWEVLPSGDGHVTRQVKAAGRYWEA